MARVVRNCLNPKCQKPFESKTSRAVYCSPECNKQYHHGKTSTTLTMKFGPFVTVTIVELDPSTDKQTLEDLIREKIPDNIKELMLNYQPVMEYA